MPSINCPNIKHPDWIALETKYGREDALRAYIRNEDSIPTISEAEKLLAKTVNNPKAEENLINKLKSFSSKDTDTQFKDIINKIKDVLHTQETIYKNNTKNSSLLEDIETLKEIIANSDELTSLNNFVNEASVRIGNAQVRMNTITSNLEKIDNDINLKPEDIKDITKNVKYDLDQVNQFLSSYNILDDIQKSINDNFLGETETIKLSASLKQAIANRQLVLSQFTDLAKKVMAKSIAEVLKSSNEKLKAGGHSKLVIDEAKLLEEFEMASKDIGVLQNNLDSAIGSTDPLLAAAAKMVKKALFDAYNSQDLPTEQSLRGLYSKTSGSKSSNVKEYNSKYLHQIDSWEKVPVLDDKGKQEKDENGILKFKYDYIKRDALILEYDTARFYKAKYDFAKKLGERPASLEDQKEWNRSWSQWFKENTVPELDEHNNIVGKRPSSKYKNIKYNKLRQDPYYQKLLDIYFEANEKLPISRQLQHGIFPQYLKKGIDRILEGKLNKEIALEEARQAFKITAQDEQFGGLQRLDGTPKKYIPIHGTSLMDQEHLSYDLLESTLKFSQMANRYEALSSIEPDINLLSEIIANRQVAETNFKGKQVINPVTKKPVAKAPGTERITNRFREFIDSQLYGEESLESTFNLAGAEISLDKVANKIGKFTVMNSMAGNLLSGMGRLTVGNLDNLVEAVGNKYNSYLGGLKALGIAKATYWSNAPGMVADWSRQDLPTNYISLLLRDYDALQGQHRDQYGKNISGNFWKKRGNSEALLAVMNGVEHEIQATTFIRMMQQQKVKQGDKQISLFDAYTKDENGNLKLKDGVEWTNDQKFDFLNTYNDINKELQGVYDTFDKSTLQRRWYGKLALIFRKYIYEGYQRRWGNSRVDWESGEFKRGYYASFISTLSHDIKNMKFNIINNWKTYTPDQKEAIAKTMTELSALVASMLLVGSLGGGGKKKDNSFFENQSLLQARRLEANINFYLVLFNYKDTMRILQNPSVTMSTLSQITDWMDQAFLTWDPHQLYYKRKTGSSPRGSDKAWQKFKKLIPLYSAIDKFAHPAQTVSIYNTK